MTASGVQESRVIEMDWWDEVALPATGLGAPAPTLNFVCVPAQHTSGESPNEMQSSVTDSLSGRSIGDKCATLWCGWVIKQGNVSVYHAG